MADGATRVRRRSSALEVSSGCWWALFIVSTCALTVAQAHWGDLLSFLGFDAIETGLFAVGLGMFDALVVVAVTLVTLLLIRLVFRPFGERNARRASMPVVLAALCSSVAVEIASVLIELLVRGEIGAIPAPSLGNIIGPEWAALSLSSAVFVSVLSIGLIRRDRWRPTTAVAGAVACIVPGVVLGFLLT